jgi:type 1 glutamine amidotransferase
LAFSSAPTWADDAEDEAGFKPIFNGKDLEGWDGNPKFWSVEDGAITGRTTAENPTQGNTFLIWRDGEVDDFVLRLDYKLVGGNSGIQYRSKDHGNWVVGGYQADFEAGPTYTGINYEERGRGILAERGKRATIAADGKKEQEQIADSAELQKLIKPEDWNSYEIIASGNHLIHKINGTVFSETIDNEAAKRAMSGILAFQVHAGPPMTVQFKNVRLKRTKLAAVPGLGDRKKLVMIAGGRSHGPGDHEFNAGCWLLKKCLDENVPQLVSAKYTNGWPKDATAFDNADAVFIYSDGGGGHPAVQQDRLAFLDALAKNGVGIACAHYAVEVPKDKGGPEFLDWIGGYFETFWSVNPHWTLQQTKLAEGHPITRGVQPFEIRDEWYYHMRFRDNMQGVTPILSALPPDATRGEDGVNAPHGGNPHVQKRKGMHEVLAWAAERPEGGRGFGYTGGHFHRNWGDDNNRKLVLNALVWTSGLEVPSDGVNSTISEDDLQKNLDPK